METVRTYIEDIMNDEFDPFQDVKQLDLVKPTKDKIMMNAMEYFKYKNEKREQKKEYELKKSYSPNTNNAIKKI